MHADVTIYSARQCRHHTHYDMAPVQKEKWYCTNGSTITTHVRIQKAILRQTHSETLLSMLGCKYGSTSTLSSHPLAPRRMCNINVL